MSITVEVLNKFFSHGDQERTYEVRVAGKELEVRATVEPEQAFVDFEFDEDEGLGLHLEISDEAAGAATGEQKAALLRWAIEEAIRGMGWEA
jgi:hypothetical protein